MNAIRTTGQLLLLAALMLLSSTGLQAQGWARLYSPDKGIFVNSIHERTDGTYWVTGFNVQSNGIDSTGVRLLRVDTAGNPIQAVDIDTIPIGISVSTTTRDEGMVFLSGYYNLSTSPHMRYFYLTRTDDLGNILWHQQVDSFYHHNNNGTVGSMDMDTTSDLGYICALTKYDSSLLHRVITVNRYDQNLGLQWQQTYFDTVEDAYVIDIKNTGDGGFLVTGRGFAAVSTNDVKIFKIDANGNLLWEYTPQNYNNWAETLIAADNNIIVCTSDTTRPFSPNMAKLDQQGNELWFQAYPSYPDSSAIYHLAEMGLNKYAVLSYNYNQSILGNRIGLSFLDTMGNSTAQRFLPTSNLANGYNGLANKMIATNDGGLLCGGVVSISGQNAFRPFLIKMDSTGQVYPMTLAGRTFYDRNGDCDRTTGEDPLNRKVITFTNATDTFRVMSVDSGWYSLGIEPGVYDVSIDLISPYWQQTSCNPGQVTLNGNDTLIDFGFEALTELPYITFSGNLRPRICAPNTYTVQYCNTGPETFYGEIQLDLDTVMLIDSASVPWNIQSGSTLTFIETNGLDIGECRTIKVYYTIPCNMDLSNTSVCVDAHAYQDTVGAQSLLWDRSNLQMDVNYNSTTDSVEFRLTNEGWGDMLNPKDLIVIEDNIIMMNPQIQLTQGETYTITLPANGSTWRATAYQTEYNPYSLFTTAAIEGAGTNGQNGFSTGFINQFPTNGAYAFHNTTCDVIRNSYDPNQKTVYPAGAGSNHIITDDIQLEYLLEFQNTGNDTAYVVRIVDTLPHYLDPATITFGASSHDYEYRFLNSHVIEFLFEGIHLVDSTTNEPESHGFVKFTIDQIAENENGTIIDNDVAIYFDYNDPVITNIARVQVGEYEVTGIEDLSGLNLDIKAWPNPFGNSAYIEVSGAQFESLELELYNLSGQIIQQQVVHHSKTLILDGANLQSGTYIFHIKAQGELIGTGKVTAIK